MNHPLVSVLMPAYNHAAFVEAALESVRLDPYPALELLILDDGSGDDTLARVQAWVGAHGSRFQRVVVRSQPNAGICPTLNRLVLEAQGDYITLLASDDALLPGGIQARVEALQAHPGWLAVFGDAEVMDEHGVTTEASAIRSGFRANPATLRDPGLLSLALLLRWCVPGPVFLARRRAYDAVEGVGLYHEGLVVEDRDFYLRLLSRRALGFLDQPVARYRVHSGGTCRGTLRPAVVADIHRSHVENLPRFRGLMRAVLWLLVREYEAEQRGQRLRRALFRRPLTLLRSWLKRR